MESASDELVHKCLENIYDLWNREMNNVYLKIKEVLSGHEFEQLQRGQKRWITFRDRSLQRTTGCWNGTFTRTAWALEICA